MILERLAKIRARVEAREKVDPFDLEIPLAGWPAIAASANADAVALLSALDATQAWSLGAIKRTDDAWKIWGPILQRPDGSIDVEQLKKELADFGLLIRSSSLVYEHVTGGRISKPLTLPECVCQEADNRIEEDIEEAVEEVTEKLRAERDALVRVAEAARRWRKSKRDPEIAEAIMEVTAALEALDALKGRK